jgi:hypothetical protein
MLIEQIVQLIFACELLCLLRRLSILLGFFDELVQVIESVRIEQSQAREMTGDAELIWSRREKKASLGSCGIGLRLMRIPDLQTRATSRGGELRR